MPTAHHASTTISTRQPLGTFASEVGITRLIIWIAEIDTDISRVKSRFNTHAYAELLQGAIGRACVWIGRHAEHSFRFIIMACEDMIPIEVFWPCGIQENV